MNFDLFEAYLELAGWGLKKDENLGIVSWEGPPKARLNLNKEESIVLLILRILFEEKGGNITLHGERTILQQEFQDKYRILTETSLKKTQLINLLKRFQGLRLIKSIGDEGNPETVILRYIREYATGRLTRTVLVPYEKTQIIPCLRKLLQGIFRNCLPITLK